MKRSVKEIVAELSALASTTADAARTGARSAKVTAMALAFGIVFFGRMITQSFSVLGHTLHLNEGHHWRQAFTYGVAWNYAHATLDFFHPRMLYEISRSNIVAMEAPIYPYLASFFLRISHDNIWSMRFISWASLVVIVAVLFHWLGEQRATGKEAWADRAGLLVAFSLSPSLVEFRSVQPDPMAAALAVLAAFFLARYARLDRTKDLVTGAVLAALAVLTKPVALGVIPGLVVLGTYGSGRWIRRGLLVSGALAAALVPHFLWDRWAVHILQTEMDGLIIISIQHDLPDMLRNLKNPGFVREALLHFLPNYSGSWWLVPAIAAGIYRSLADVRLRRLGVSMLVWLAVYLVELIAFGDRLHSNAYYFVLAPAAVLLFAAFGIGAMVDMLDSPNARPKLIATRAGLVALLLLPLGLYFAVPIDWSSVAGSALALERNKAVWMNDLGIALLLAGILVAFGIAAFIRPRRVPVWVGIPLVAAVLATAYWPWQDANQYFRYYEGTAARRGSAPRLEALRAAMKRHSTVGDRVVIDPPELVLFYHVERNGFGPADIQTPAGLENVRRRHGRLYVQFEPGGAPPPRTVPARLLESGANFKIYCLAADDCQ